MSKSVALVIDPPEVSPQITELVAAIRWGLVKTYTPHAVEGRMRDLARTIQFETLGLAPDSEHRMMAAGTFEDAEMAASYGLISGFVAAITESSLAPQD